MCCIMLEKRCVLMTSAQAVLHPVSTANSRLVPGSTVCARTTTTTPEHDFENDHDNASETVSTRSARTVARAAVDGCVNKLKRLSQPGSSKRTMPHSNDC